MSQQKTPENTTENPRKRKDITPVESERKRDRKILDTWVWGGEVTITNLQHEKKVIRDDYAINRLIGTG